METNEDEQSSPVTFGQFGSKQHMDTMENYITRDEVITEQRKAIDELPFSKRWPFEAADTYLPVYAGIAGLICNSYLRRMLMIRRGALVMAFPMALASAASLKIGWLVGVTTPILAGDLQCSICGEMRGGLVNVGLGVVYPMLMGLPLATAIAKRSHTVDVPKLKLAVTDWPKFSQFWTRKLRYFKGQFITLVIFQAAVGCFVAKKQMDVCTNEVKTKYAKVQASD